MSCQRKLRHYYGGLILKGKCFCYLCGKNIVKYSDLSLDHVLPKALGGIGSRSNLLPAHKSCNCKKDCMTLEDYIEQEFNIKVK